MTAPVPSHVSMPLSRIIELLACDNHRVMTVAQLGSVDTGPYLCGNCRRPARIVQSLHCPHGWDPKDCRLCEAK